MAEGITAAISGALLDTRTKLGKSREDVAAAARSAGAPDRLSASALRNIEDGRRDVTVPELVWLAQALHVQPWRLLGEQVGAFTDGMTVAGEQDEEPVDGGKVTAATRAAIDGLTHLSGRQRALAAVALTLAEELDGYAEKRQPPALARELSATLATIWDLNPLGDEEDDDLGAA